MAEIDFSVYFSIELLKKGVVRRATRLNAFFEGAGTDAAFEGTARPMATLEIVVFDLKKF
jgi:hypothetical protein